MLADLFVLAGEPLARARRLVLDDQRPEVEELFQRQQVLVGLLAPLAEADQHEVLLQVPLLLCQGVQPSVLDRDGGLQCEPLRPLHFFWAVRVHAVALGEDGRTDGLVVRDQRQRQQRAHAERLHVRVRHALVRAGVLDDKRLGLLEQVEQEGWLCALAAQPAPEVLLVGGGGSVPALVVLLVKRDLACGGVDEPRQVVRDERERLVEVDRRRDGAADVGAQLELLGVAARLFVQASRLHG